VQTDLFSQERLKAMLVAADSDFYLVGATRPGATYKVLWYRRGLGHCCKVNILRPGVMNIPRVPPERIGRVDGLPLMPLAGILLLKLQAWEDHRSANKMDLKDWADQADLARLLPIAIEAGLRLSEETWLPDDFVKASRSRAKRLIPYAASGAREMYSQWQKIGLL
jgi:hypothetical protein